LNAEDRNVVVPPKWWEILPRAVYSRLERVETGQPWFEVYRIDPGIYVFYEPGHTRGNICLLMDGNLFAGDALFGGNGGLRPPPSRFSSDPGEALESISKLETFDFEAVYLSHGEDVLTGGRERLAGLLRSLRSD
jgi:glyoxylase-like metal-dependent hydrolase (beta-lactamase superfamily II)